MKIRFPDIKPEDCVFIVNKEKRTVVCYMVDVNHQFVDTVPYDFDEFLRDDRWSSHSKYVLNTKYCGIAKCAPDDEWDEEIGRRIAYHRMLHKFHKDFFRVASKFINTVDALLLDYLEQVNSFGERCSRNYQRQLDWISEHVKMPTEE